MIDFIINHPILFGLGWLGLGFIVAVFFGKFCAVGRGGADD